MQLSDSVFYWHVHTLGSRLTVLLKIQVETSLAILIVPIIQCGQYWWACIHAHVGIDTFNFCNISIVNLLLYWHAEGNRSNLHDCREAKNMEAFL